MSFKISFNESDGIEASRVTVSGSISMTNGRMATANRLLPSVFEIEREASIAPSNDFFNAAVASPDSANEATLSVDMEISDGTAYSVTVEEGTVVAWRLTQEDPDAPVLETTTVLARKAEIECESGKAELTAV